MDTQEILFKLEQVKEKEKDKQYFTGELNVYEMVSDVIDFINQQDNDVQRLTQSIKTAVDRYRTLDRKYTKLRKGNYYLKNERDNALENNKYLREYIKALDHSGLVDKLNEMERTINSLDYELNDIYHPQPYKFEQLETNLTVFDKALKELVLIGVMCGKHILNNTVPYFRFGDEELYNVNFEEGRFFPPTKAMEYQGKEDKND